MEGSGSGVMHTKKANDENNAANDCERASPKVVSKDDKISEGGGVLGLDVVHLADGARGMDLLELQLQRGMIHSSGRSVGDFRATKEASVNKLLQKQCLER
jgi:hypothetical protein